MPRIVDHERRRRELAEAVWRVVLRDGAHGASVRGVAREAGWSPGSLRHYFSTQGELLAFAMRLVNERVRARITALPVEGSPVDVAVRRCEEVLPLDTERRTEAEVWLALTGAGLADPDLRAIRSEADDGIRELCERLVEYLAAHGAVDAGRDLAFEAERLRAVVDGVTLHLLLDESPDPATARRLVRHHLTELARGA